MAGNQGAHNSFFIVVPTELLHGMQCISGLAVAANVW